jgi:hypothetical protein
MFAFLLGDVCEHVEPGPGPGCVSSVGRLKSDTR